MNAPKQLNIGFFKAIQGAFTQEVIDTIIDELRTEHDAAVTIVDFRQGVLIDGKVYVGDICLNDFDVYFWHDTLWPAKTGSDSYYVHLLRAIGRDAVVINTADSTERVNDKLRSHEALKAAGLPVSTYALVNSEDTEGIARAFDELGGDVLIKPRFGGWGKGIVRCTSADNLQDVIELVVASAGRAQQFLLEKYYPNDMAAWTSVSMIGSKPVIGYRKSLAIGGSDWKVHDPLKRDGKGERSEYVEVSGELKQLASEAQRAIGKSIVGFDFIATDEGYKIVDENGRPGLYAHCLKKAGITLADEIVALIVSAAHNRNG